MKRSCSDVNDDEAGLEWLEGMVVPQWMGCAFGAR